MNVSFGAVLIGVQDILKSQPFYENVFGVVFNEIRPPFSSFTMNGIEFQIEENSPNRSEGWAKKYLGGSKGFCFETDDIEAFLKKVIENGGAITAELHDHPWGYREANFADLDGNIFIIEQEIKSI